MAYFDVEVPDAPFECLIVGVEKRVQPVSIYCAAPVEDLNGYCVVVAVDDHFGAERISFVGGYEGIASGYPVARGCYPVGIAAAALWACTIAGYTHSNTLPLAGLSIRLRPIQIDCVCGYNRGAKRNNPSCLYLVGADNTTYDVNDRTEQEDIQRELRAKQSESAVKTLFGCNCCSFQRLSFRIRILKQFFGVRINLHLLVKYR